MSANQNTLMEKERLRSAREALNASGNQAAGNNNVFISEQDRWEQLSNTSMRVVDQLPRAAADEPPRAAGQQLNTDQQVNNRLANLEGETAAARRNGGQGVYPSQYNNDNQYSSQPNDNGHMPTSLNYNNDNGHMPTSHNYNGHMPTSHNYNGHMPISHGNLLQGEHPSGQMRRISSGRDRTGNDNIARYNIPWPNEHCLIGVDRRKVTYDHLTQAQWQAGLMNILDMERDPLCRKTMLKHITRLSQDVVDCGFRVARGAHAAVLVALEEGRVSWMEPEAIEAIRRDSVSRVYFEAEGPGRSSSVQGTTSAARPKPQGVTKSHSVCKHYNKNTCSSNGDHVVGNILYKHVCSFCSTKGKSYPHTEAACNKKHDKNSS